MTAISSEQKQAKAFVLAVIALAPMVSLSAFNVGVYGVVFYDQLLAIWAASLAVLGASFFIRDIQHNMTLFSRRGQTILLLPSLLVGLEIWLYHSDALPLLRMFLSAAVLFVSIPYILYFFVMALIPDLDKLSQPRLRRGIIIVNVTIGCLGFAAGINHRLLITCEEFATAGNSVPKNCYVGGEPGPAVADPHQ